MTIGDVDASAQAGCWCCEGEYTPADMVTLGAHPEVHVCVGCAKYLHRRARSLHDARNRPTPLRLARQVIDRIRSWIVERGVHRRPLLGCALRALDRRLP